MIRRLFVRIAGRFADTAWLREMRRREVLATRSALHHERRARRNGNPVEGVLRGNRNGERP